jgi:hypothetical protein
MKRLLCVTANRRHQKLSSEAATTDHSLHELQVQFSEKYQSEIKKINCPKVERLLAWFDKEFHCVAAS